MTPVEHTVLRLLKKAAAEGRICPTNSELAAAAGIKSLSGPARAMQLLEADGHIIVQRFTASRIVTIVGTGLATADPFDTLNQRRTTHLRLGRPAGAHGDAVSPATRARPDACPCCGTRPDVARCDCKPRTTGITVLRGRIPQELAA